MRLYLFHLKIKSHWLGPTYKEEGVAGNDITRSNVPDIRIAFRHETFTEEINCIIGAVLATWMLSLSSKAKVYCVSIYYYSSSSQESPDLK